MSTRTTPHRRMLVAIDMEKYSRQVNPQQRESQATVVSALREAADLGGLNRPSWQTQATGDGELAVLPAHVDELAVITRFVPELDRLLREHNHSRLREAAVRLRVAVHVGLVHLDSANGWAGDAVVKVCRLVNAAPLKRALTMFPHAGAALIVSDEIYRDIVRQRYDGLRPERYGRIWVDDRDKEFGAPGWIYVPDENASSLAVPDSPLVESPPTTAAHGQLATNPVPRPSTPDGRLVGTLTAHGSAIAVGDHGQVSVESIGVPVAPSNGQQ